MHLTKLTLLASIASVAFSNCVRDANDCPPSTHAEYEPEICLDIGYPPQYHLLCVSGVNARQGSFAHRLPRGPSRQAPLRESMCGESGASCSDPYDCCNKICDMYNNN
ncbi:hypothetical protein DFQ26_000256 [Actinomortierella ambigua]|nr:hypothetical protein DFQ26_000256 [Actinomortierella ambigua]